MRGEWGEKIRERKLVQETLQQIRKEFPEGFIALKDNHVDLYSSSFDGIPLFGAPGIEIVPMQVYDHAKIHGIEAVAESLAKKFGKSKEYFIRMVRFVEKLKMLDKLLLAVNQ